MWSVNDGLSGNLWKPPETDHGGLRQVSESFTYLVSFFSKKNINRKIRKPAGNLRGRFPAGFRIFLLIEKFGNRPRRFPAGFRRFPAGYRIIDGPHGMYMHTCANLISIVVTRAMSNSSKNYAFLMC